MVEARTTAEQVKSFLEGQLARYQQIQELSRKQLAAVKSGDTSALMELLAQKQELIQTLDGESVAAAPILKLWESERLDVQAMTRESVTAVHEELKKALAELISLEDEAKALIAKNTGDSGRQMATLQKGKQMLKAYGTTPPPGGGRFTDNRK